MNDKILDRIIELALVFITVGFVFDLKSLINVSFFVGMIANVIHYIRNKNNINLMEIVGKIDIKLVLFMLIFSCSLFLSSSYSENEVLSLKYADHYFKWMFKSFFIACLLGVFLKEGKKYVLTGICISDFVIIISVFYNYFILGISRPGAVNMAQPNMAAGVIIFLLPFILVSSMNGFKYVKILISVLSIIALCLTGSRGGMIAAFGILCIYAWKNRIVFYDFIRQYYKTSFIVLVLLVMVLTSVNNSNYVNRMTEAFRYRDNLIEHRVGGDRLLLWKSSVKMIEDYPVFGVGLRNFNYVYNHGKYIDSKAKEPHLESPHNIVLHLCVEAGLIGALVFLLLVGYQLKYLFRYINYDNLALAYFLALIGMLVHGMVDYLFMVKGYYQLYWFLCGIVWLHMNKNYGMGENEISIFRRN